LLDNEPETKRRGIEFGLIGALYYRVGSIQDNDKLSTKGYGFRLRGLIDWLKITERARSESSILGYLITHIDLSFDYAKWDADDGQHPETNTKFSKICFSF